MGEGVRLLYYFITAGMVVERKPCVRENALQTQVVQSQHSSIKSSVIYTVLETLECQVKGTGVLKSGELETLVT